MTEEISKKVINIFSKHKQSSSEQTEEPVKYYAGFDYVKLIHDNNGKRFNVEKLKKYAQCCHYIVRVMRVLGEDVFLYNYDVPNEKLFDFIKSFQDNTLNGTIIEIDKYFPDGLA